MKKLVVIPEKTTSSKTNQISEFFSMQYNYGLYDFNAEKIINDACEAHNLKIASIEAPYYTLIDENNEVITAMFSEDYV